MRLPMSLPTPGILSTASKNCFGMKWVYASMRMRASSGSDRAAERGLAALGGAGREGARPRPGCQGLLRRNVEARAAFDVGEAPREAFTFGVEQGGGAGARDRVDPARHRYPSGHHGTDDPRFDRGVVCGAALPGVAIALDQPRALGDFEPQRPRLCRRGG